MTLPHIRSKNSVKKFYWTLSACLIPFFMGLIFQEGIDRISLFGASVSGAALAEITAKKLLKRKSSLEDGHTFFHAFLFSLMLPAGVLPFTAAFYAFAGIFLAKEIFGGLGLSPFHPAAAALLFLSLGNPSIVILSAEGMKDFLKLEILRPAFGGAQNDAVQGSLGITAISMTLISLGGIFLILKKYLDLAVPLLFFLPLLVTKAALISAPEPVLFLAAFFGMADPSVLPFRMREKRLFAFTLGLFYALFRLQGPLLSSLALALITMNLFLAEGVPLTLKIYLKRGMELFAGGVLMILIFFIGVEIWIPMGWIKTGALLIFAALCFLDKKMRGSSWKFTLEVFICSLLAVWLEGDFSLPARLWTAGKLAFFISLFHLFHDRLNQRNVLFPPPLSLNSSLVRFAHAFFVILPLYGLFSLLP
ncbi:MAG: RnfABCDGE type electron transport complex subunit D [Candidatus Omnitrophica bacterium]|nr:RnfABCDGE type electron transport complex subunit D [Candidatus Omnitrophota bacterium]